MIAYRMMLSMEYLHPGKTRLTKQSISDQNVHTKRHKE